MNKDKFHIRISLVITSTNKKSAESLVIKKGDIIEFPSKFLSIGELPNTIAENILLEYTGIKTGWTVLLPCGIINIENGVIDILFTCFIPEPTRIRIDGSTWMSHVEIEKYNNDNIKKILYESIWRSI